MFKHVSLVGSNPWPYVKNDFHGCFLSGVHICFRCPIYYTAFYIPQCSENVCRYHCFVYYSSNADISVYVYLKYINLFIFFIVVQLQLSPFPPHYSPLPYPLPPPTFNPLPAVHVHGSFIHFLDLNLPLVLMLPPSTLLRSLSICCLFPCLWFYFARLFVLLIRLHL